jgi:phage shock protein E
VKLTTENKIILLGGVLGIVLGFLYYYFIGCENGCPIKSNLFLMSIYGGILGGSGASLLYSLIKPKKN